MEYPIYFEDYHRCIKCGAPKIVPINQYGNEQKFFIYPITHMVCNNCGAEYFVKWIHDKNGKVIPICCSDDEKNKFIDEFNKGENK